MEDNIKQPEDNLTSPVNQPLSNGDSYNMYSGSSRRQKRFIALATALLFIFALGLINYFVLKTSPKASAAIAPAQVSITNSGFVPASISIKSGQAVYWTNNSNLTQMVSTGSNDPIDPLPAFNSQQALNPGDDFSYVFNKQGTYTYYDNLSPSYRGIVIVK